MTMTKAVLTENKNVSSKNSPSLPAENSRFLKMEISDPTILGGTVKLSFEPRVTVLFGKNGAGKSALFEMIKRATQIALSGIYDARTEPSSHYESLPSLFLCEVQTPTTKLRYEYALKSFVENKKDSDLNKRLTTLGQSLTLSEKCLSLTKNKTLWTTEKDILTFADKETLSLSPGVGALSRSVSQNKKLPALQERQALERIFSGFDFIHPGIFRSTEKREEIFSPYQEAELLYSKSTYSSYHLEVFLFMRRLFKWYETNKETYEEFCYVARRVGLFKQIDLDRRKPPASIVSNGLVSFVMDGVNIGFIADGILRVAIILSCLLDKSHTTIFLEEPETALHPGLLAKLLAELEAYSIDKQIIVTTHSPQVISFTKPEQLRLVERNKGKTSVHPLSKNLLPRIESYLYDQGTLGEYVFSGALDD